MSKVLIIWIQVTRHQVRHGMSWHTQKQKVEFAGATTSGKLPLVVDSSATVQSGKLFAM